MCTGGDDGVATHIPVVSDRNPLFCVVVSI